MTMLQSAVEHYARQQAITRRAIKDGFRTPGLPGRVAQVVTEAQTRAAQDALDSIDPMLDEQSIVAPPAGLFAAASFAGTASDGRPLDTLLAQATDLFTLGLMITTQIQDAARQAAATSIADRPKIGYVRMLNPPSCSRCVVQAGKFFRYNQGFLRHPRCDCRHVPTLENVSGDLTTDPDEYFASLTREEQDRTFTKAGAEAIRLGANVGQVVNARRVTSGMSFAQVPAVKRDARGNLYTTEGTTRRGRAYLQQKALRRNGDVQMRLMPETILMRAKDREDAQRLLRLYGFIVDDSAVTRGRLLLADERRAEAAERARQRRARA
jgi:hypothetical protein